MDRDYIERALEYAFDRVVEHTDKLAKRESTPNMRRIFRLHFMAGAHAVATMAERFGPDSEAIKQVQALAIEKGRVRRDPKGATK